MDNSVNIVANTKYFELGKLIIIPERTLTLSDALQKAQV